tara:strand:- start:237 stop:416 length:180 start_codon:yes stop_codon:yes gene_type:complete
MEQKKLQPYLKKGKGILASHFHGETQFSQQRKQKIINEQCAREQQEQEQEQEQPKSSRV